MRWRRRKDTHATIVPGGPAASPACCNPRTIVEGHRPRCPCCNPRHQTHQTFVAVGTEAGPPIESHATFVPAAGEAAGPPIESHETFVPVGTEAGAPPIESHATCVPAAGEAGAPPIESHATFVPAAGEAAGPPVEFHATSPSIHRTSPRCIESTGMNSVARTRSLHDGRRVAGASSRLAGRLP